MNTHGHEEVANDAGFPLLAEAFGRDKRSLRALHLGNWLTDVSQTIDPVTLWSLSEKLKGGADAGTDALKKSIDRLVEELAASVFDLRFDRATGDRVLRAMKPAIEADAKRAVRTLHDVIDFYLAPRTNDRDSRVAAFFRDCFLVMGYFKFVHPERSGDPPRMNFEGFMQVFGRVGDTAGASTSPAPDRPGAYTQYYPHEHMDRPEALPPQHPAVFAPGKQLPRSPFRVSPGQVCGPRSPRRREPPENESVEADLYSYLRDQIEMTAGLLADTDVEFRQACAQGVRDDDPKWYLTLARLGHALHQVEDFFAHSNWVELAAKRLGPEFLETVIPPETGAELVDRMYTTYRKRLKRHLTTPLADWREHEDEDWVVTGFFDGHDALISLAHVSEELFGMDVDDPYAAGFALFEHAKEAVEHPRTVVYELQKLMRQTLDYLTNPTRALADDDNYVARSLEERFGPDIVRLRRPGVSEAVAQQVVRESAYLGSAPKEVRDAFFRVIVEGSRVSEEGKIALSLYETIREVSRFVADPLAWLADWLPKEVRQRLIDAFKFYGRERFYDWIGASRIGCHSLLAKDHARAPFYEQQKACATAVHWYVVKTLLRWRTDSHAGYIDWLELLEYFLRNPLPPPGYGRTTIEVAVSIVHVTREDDHLQSLARRYQQTADGRFTWRTIADANYNTVGLPNKDAFDIINRILRESGAGYPVALPNYAYKAGVRVMIPRQKMQVPLCTPPDDEVLWYKEVFDKGWQVFRGRENPETGLSEAPLEHHRPIVINLAQLQEISRQGYRLRRKARDEYRPR